MTDDPLTGLVRQAEEVGLYEATDGPNPLRRDTGAEPPRWTVVLDRSDDEWIRVDWNSAVWWPVGSDYGGLTWAELNAACGPLRIVASPVEEQT